MAGLEGVCCTTEDTLTGPEGEGDTKSGLIRTPTATQLTRHLTLKWFATVGADRLPVFVDLGGRLKVGLLLFFIICRR